MSQFEAVPPISVLQTSASQYMCYISRLVYIVHLLGVHAGRHFRSRSPSLEVHEGPEPSGHIKFRPESKWYGSFHVQYHAPRQVVADDPISNTSRSCEKHRLDGPCSKGVFVLLHSCQHYSGDFFTLPEETKITSAVIKQGFVALVPDAPAHTGGCWAPYQDGLVLFDAINLFLDEKGLKDKPLYGVGISSGGVMLARLISSYKMPFRGSHYVVSPGAAHALNADPKPGAFATHDFPRSSFVYMRKDYYAPPKAIDVAAKALKKRGTDVLVLESKPKTVQTLLRRASSMNIEAEMMHHIILQMHSWGYLESRCKACHAGEARTFNDTLALGLRQGSADGLARLFFDHPTLGVYFKWDTVRVRALNEELHYIEAVHGPTADHIEVAIQFLLTGERPT